MKGRFILLVLAASVVFSLTACGSYVETGETDNRLTAEEIEPGEMAPGDDSFGTSMTMGSYCTIYLSGYSETDDMISLSATLKNTTSDTTIDFDIAEAAVNGAQIYPDYHVTLSPHRKSLKSIKIDKSELEQYGITECTALTLRITATDANNPDEHYLANKTEYIYPYGSAYAVTYERESLDTDTVLEDNEYATVTVTGYESDDEGNYTVNLFLVNKTDSDLALYTENETVNGNKIDSGYDECVFAGCCRYSSIIWSSEDLKSCGIDDVTDISFIMTGCDDSNRYTEYFSTDVTLNP